MFIIGTTLVREMFGNHVSRFGRYIWEGTQNGSTFHIVSRCAYCWSLQWNCQQCVCKSRNTVYKF